MNLDHFKVSDMNKLSAESMSYTVGGANAIRTGEPPNKDGIYYSNDYQYGNEVHVVLHGGDWSKMRMDRECCSMETAPPLDPSDPENIIPEYIVKVTAEGVFMW